MLAIAGVADQYQYTSIAIGVDGLPIVSYYDTTGLLKVAHCGDLKCQANTTTPTVFSDHGQYTSITIGADGLPIISYKYGSQLRVTRCNDVACAGLDEASNVLDGQGSMTHTSITIGTDGLPIVSYLGGFGELGLKAVHCNDAACAGMDETITEVDSSIPYGGRFNSITIGADGLPIISYLDEGGHLKVAHCANVFCTPYFRRR
jgi:hypothetical protein